MSQLSGAPPSRIGPYEILAPLGAGGMGMVYRARHIETGAEVALKTVLTSRTTQFSGLRREIHALMQIHHPGVVGFVAEGVHDGRPWYAMELLEGTTLSALMRPSRAAAGPDESTASDRSATTTSSATPGPADDRTRDIDGPLGPTMTGGGRAGPEMPTMTGLAGD